MNYPLISEYIEAIKAAEDNFVQLKHLRPVIGDDGLPVMTSGNFAVVFKMKDEQTGKLYAVKCFTKEQEGRAEAYHQIAEELKDVDSPYLVSLRYLDKELFVDTAQTSETEFPVLLMDWVEGKTLDKYLRENLDDKYALELLAYRFSQLAQWLMPQPFAHGDLKPDNILVREDGTLALVDYDGMYVPAMKGQKVRELGSPDFRHPLRTENDFDEHIDNFSLLVITLSVLVACNSPQYFSLPLFIDKDFINPTESLSIKKIYPSNNSSLNKSVSTLINALVENDITLTISDYDAIAKHIRWDYYNYAQNYYELLKEQNVDDYTLWRKFNREDHFEIDAELYPILPIYNNHEYDYLFFKGSLLRIWDHIIKAAGDGGDDDTVWNEIFLPSDTIVIGKDAFCDCYLVELIILPNSVKYIGDNAFYGCKNLRYVVFPDSIEAVGENIFNISDSHTNEEIHCADSLQGIVVPKGTKEYYHNLLPNYQHLIVDDFYCFLRNIRRGNSLGRYAAYLRERIFQDFEDRFNEVDEKYELSREVSEEDLANAWTDEYGVMYSKDGKRLLRTTRIFKGKVDEYKVKDGVVVICNTAFVHNWILNRITLPESLVIIGHSAFLGCGLTCVDIPDGVISIGHYAFSRCHSLESVKIPCSVKVTGLSIFANCTEEYNWWDKVSLQVPVGTRKKFEDLLPEYKENIIEQVDKECLRTDVTEDDLSNAWTDEYDVMYSKDSTRLLQASQWSNYVSYLVNNGVKVICDYAFWGMRLEHIYLPDSLLRIGRGAFNGCFDLRYIIIPSGVNKIEDDTFNDCFELYSIKFLGVVNQIGAGAFTGCRNLKSISIPPGSKEIFEKLLPMYKDKLVEEI